MTLYDDDQAAILDSPIGINGVSVGGTGADMSATGGSRYVVMQESAGAAFTTRPITFIQPYVTVAGLSFVAANASSAAAAAVGVANASAVQAVIDEWEALIAAGTRSGVTIVLPGFGETLPITGGLTINQDRIHIVGQGIYATRIKFIPTGAGQKCFHFTKTSAAIIYQCSIRGLSIYSDDTTNQKIAIHVNDGSNFAMREVEIGPIGKWTDSGKGSIGVLVTGRDRFSIEPTSIVAADRPVVVRNNVNQPALDFDVSCINGIITYADSNPNIEYEDGTVMTNAQFSNMSMNLGTHGFYYNDTGATGQSYGVTFGPNNRWEQATSAGWLFHCVRTNENTLNLNIIGNHGGGPSPNPGMFKLRRVLAGWIAGNSTIGSGGTVVALDADSTCNRLVLLGNYFQSTTTFSLTGLKRDRFGGGPDSGTPGSALEILTSTTDAFIDSRAIQLGMGSGTGTYTPTGVADRTSATVATDNNTNEKTLWSYTLPGNSLAADGRVLRVWLKGTTAANANTKTIRFKFGGTTVVLNNVTLAPNNVNWRAMVTVTRTGATAQLIDVNALFGTANQGVNVTTAAETLSGYVVVSVTGQDAQDSVAVGSSISLYPLTAEFV